MPRVIIGNWRVIKTRTEAAKNKIHRPCERLLILLPAGGFLRPSCLHSVNGHNCVFTEFTEFIRADIYVKLLNSVSK